MLEGTVNRYLTSMRSTTIVLDVHCRGERDTDGRQQVRRCGTSRVFSRLSTESGEFQVI